MSAPRVAVIGCGLTGSFTALMLRRALPEASVTVWEKSTNAGRTFTKRTADSSIDMGAQYISQTPEYAEAHKRLGTLSGKGQTYYKCLNLINKIIN